MWLHARVLCGCAAGCEVLVKHGVGSGDHEEQQSRRCHAPLLGVAAARPCSRGGDPPKWSWPGEEGTGDVGPEGSRGGAWAWGE